MFLDILVINYSTMLYDYLSNGSSSHEFPEDEIQSRSTKFEQLVASPSEKKIWSPSRHLSL